MKINKKYFFASQRGFSLVEILLYISIISVIVFTTSFYLFVALRSKVKNQTIAEVEQQGEVVLRFITKEIRNAREIGFPFSGNSSDRLVLIDEKGQTVVIEARGNFIYLTKNNSSVKLTSSRVVVSDFIMSNFSRPETPGIVRAQFALSHINPESRQEYNYDKYFFTSTSLRQ